MMIKEVSKYFEQKYGRPLRVLHIGNIANNAYLNSKILRSYGIESDVLCYDYYHIMGCPEWEDADFIGDYGDDFNPDWANVDLKGFARPEWFFNGPLLEVLNHIDELRNISDNHDNNKSIKPTKSVFTKVYEKGQNLLASFLYFVKRALYWLFPRVLYVILRRVYHNYLAIKHKIISKGFQIWPNKSQSENNRIFQNILSKFKSEFPGRSDQLSMVDLISYQSVINDFSKVFEYYDIVHAYATDGIYPLLGEKPYVAYEHGTIRSIPFDEATQGRLCAITYNQANHVAITNCDAINSVDRLNIKNYTFVPHPVNEEWFTEDEYTINLRGELRAKLNSDFIIFHPSRQHWDEDRHPSWEKGNDFFIKGFADFVKNVNKRAACVMVDWGAKVQESKLLLKELGIVDRVLWIKPQPNRNMIRYIMATEALADQFYLGAFGSTTPKALALGKPTFLHLNEDVHKWCFDEMPPVLNVQTEDEISKGLARIYQSPEFYDDISRKSKEWYLKYHSNELIAEKLLNIYQESLHQF